MNGLMLHCGSEEVTLDQVKAVPVPQATDTWYPVAYGEAVDYLKAQSQRALGLEIESEGYGLNAKGDQMFALLTMKTDSQESGLSIGMRQSYNKSLALATAVGQQVFVCDNLCFSGSAFMVVRKNTKNVWADFRRMISAQLQNALGHYGQMEKDTRLMKATPCHEQRGYAILGVALGEGLLTPTQATVAYGDWRKPRHEEFSERNVWSLYNAVTEGLKKGAPARLLDRHAAAHDFFMERLAA
jgi:hypothetical protein